VLAPEELIASKVFVTRRERFDGADIVHVIYGTPGQLDWERLFELVGEHWEMLLCSLVLFRYVYPAQTHYVPNWVWQELLTRLMKEIKQPNPSARFRGSLVDDKMFAIDINGDRKSTRLNSSHVAISYAVFCLKKKKMRKKDNIKKKKTIKKKYNNKNTNIKMYSTKI